MELLFAAYVFREILPKNVRSKAIRPEKLSIYGEKKSKMIFYYSRPRQGSEGI